MKNSKKIFIMVGLTIFATFLICVYFLKQEAIQVVANYQKENGFRNHTVGEYQKVVFGSGWEVSVSGIIGEFVSIQHNDANNPRVNNVDGTLYFDMTYDTINADMVRVNIRTDNLNHIKAAKGTSIHLVELEVDSLIVEVENQQSIATTDCAIGYLKIISDNGVVFTSTLTEAP